YLDAHGFIDIETPMLARSTPEGARDYLVPSRVHPGEFFALPQSPQLFKQLLMIAGYDRYYQITKCFRDEDLRADRQPEFTQIDVETSFMTEGEIREMFEGMIRSTFQNVLGIDIGAFPVMKHTDAMRLYGSDKPDLRVQLEFTELTDVMKDVDFKVFSGPANQADGRVVGLRVPGGSEMSRGEIDGHSEFGKSHNLMEGAWRPLWVIDFPMFEYDDDAQRWNAVHHPFTSPKDGHEDWLETDPGRCVAKAYDAVLNGIELGGGSVRIHREDVQSKVFRALKIGAEEAQLKFGFLLDALQYGAPPHGGIAIGLDRLVML